MLELTKHSLTLNIYFLYRKGLQSVLGSNSQESLVYSAKEVSGIVDVANLVVRLLPSKDGAVLRRLLMTAVSTFQFMIA